jgi:hypothetical protein
MFQPEKKETEKILYHMGLAVCAVLAVFAFLSKQRGMPEEIQAFLFTCPLYAWTGYYCPGCGGTRAISAFLKGQFFRSFLYHPAAFFGLIYFLIFMGSRFLNRLSGGRFPEVRFRMVYVYIGILLLLLNFFVKNWLHFRTGIDILGMI